MEHLFPQCFDGFILFYCRRFHFCTAPFGGCAMYTQVLGIGWVYRCSHGNGASIPVVFWCRWSPFCISLHLYPTLFKAPLTVRLHIYSHIFWPWSSWHAGTHTQELVRSIVAVGLFPFGALFARLFKSNWMALSQVVAPSILHDCFFPSKLDFNRPSPFSSKFWWPKNHFPKEWF